MSLINQMLQDLEQRSVGNLAGAMHSQIRAVPERRRIHPAWWLVLLLSLILIGAAGWYWTRPAPVAPVTPNLALKIAPGLSALPSPVAQSPLPSDVAATAPAETAPAARPDIASSNEDASAKQLPALAKEPKKIEEEKGPARVQENPAPNPARDTKHVVDDSAHERAVAQASLTKQVKELTPQQEAENEFRKAGVSLQAGRQADAIAGMQQALKLDPKHAAARQTLVGLLLQSKRNDEALRLAQDGLALDPAQPGLTMILARVQVEQGDQPAALATLERGLPYSGMRADYHAFLAALLQREKRNKEAIEQYTIALSSAPQSGVWWMGLGISLQTENHLPEAREAFMRARNTNSLAPELQAFVDQKLLQLH